MITFQKAVKEQVKLRLAIYGPAGAGKTASALRIAHGIGGRIAFIDTENYSASRYADGLNYAGEFVPFSFDVVSLTKPTIENYLEAIQSAENAGYNVLIIDSLSHGWQELLEEIDRIAKTKYRGNSWSAWSDGTPKQKSLIRAITQSNMHIIATMRAKTEWETGKDEKTGKSKPVRVGLAPEQGKGIEYEFDMLMEINDSHYATIIKDRSGKFQDMEIHCPDEKFGEELAEWLTQGVVPVRPAPQSEPISIAKPTVPKPKPAVPKPAVPESKFSEISAEEMQNIINLQNRLRDRVENFSRQNLRGYGDRDKAREEIYACLGTHTIGECYNAKYLQDMLTMLEEWQKKTEVPFAPMPPKDEQINAILQEIDNKLKVKYMPESVADSFAKQALSIAGKGSLEALNAILMAVDSYANKQVPVSEEVSRLQNEISQKLKVLVDGKIDGFETSKRMTNSIIKHLGTKTIKQCQDINKLTEYSEHLDYIIHNSGKEEEK